MVPFHPQSEEDIIRTERSQIDTRRRHAFEMGKSGGSDTPSSNPQRTEEEGSFSEFHLEGPPVGLAISGGGIRSASMALGLIQALYRRGLLSHFDYLSTVSGGTYAGAFLSSQITAQETSIDWTPADPPSVPGAVRLPLYQALGQPQPSCVSNLASAGDSLKHPVKFLSRHLWGLLTVNAFLISGLVAIAALAAMLFRLCDLPAVAPHLAELGFRTDLARAFFPATLAFCLWLVTAGLAGRYGREFARFPPFSSWAYLLLIATIAMGVISLFSTGNLDLSFLERSANLQSEFGDRVRAGLKWIGQLLTIIMAVAIVPLFSIRDLIRSGTAPRNRVEGWVFNLASVTVLLGIPLMLFYFLSAEDISNTIGGGSTNYKMTSSYVRDWKKLQEAIQITDDDAKQAEEQLNPGTEGIGTATKGPREQTVLADPESDRAAGNSDKPGTKRVRSTGQWLILFKDAAGDRIKDVLKESPTGATRRPSSESGSSVDQDQLTAYLKHESMLNERLSQSGNWRFPLAIATYLPQVFNGRDSLLRDGEMLGREADKLVAVLGEKILDKETFYLDLIGRAIPGKPGVGDPGENIRKLTNATPGVLKELETVLTSSKALANANLTEIDSNSPLSDSLLTGDMQGPLMLKFLQRAHELNRTTLVNSSPASEAEINQQRRDVRLVNWNLLRILYGKQIFHSPREVFAAVVAVPDLSRRFWIFLFASLLFLALGLISVNSTTIHGFYRDQLAPLWIYPHPVFRHAIPLSEVKTTERGGPLHLINTAVNLRGLSGKQRQDPTDRFLFTRQHVGSRSLGFTPIGELLEGNYKLDDVTALSGAAISPLASENVLVRVLLIVLNFRLGQWMPNPAFQLYSWAGPSAVRLLSQHLTRPPQHRHYLFVSDGGHHENTGIESLLVRRCRVIVAADFSQDEHYVFADFRKLCLRLTDQFGVRLIPHPEYPMSNLIPDEKTRLCHSRFALFRILYPEEHPRNSLGSWLILIKPGFQGDEPVGLRECRKDYGSFPHDATLDQMLSSDRFMVYRQLGDHLGETLCNSFFSKPTAAGTPRGMLWLANDWEPGMANTAPVTPGDTATAGTKGKGSRKQARTVGSIGSQTESKPSGPPGQ